jgi:dTDP-4-amino-4,6-dideoxygalactose transaminase
MKPYILFDDQLNTVGIFNFLDALTLFVGKKLGYGRKRLRVTDHSASHVLSLPVHPGLGEPEIDRVGDAFVTAARQLL